MRLSLFTLAEAVLVGISTQQRKLLYHNSFPCPVSASSSKVIRGKHAIKDGKVKDTQRIAKIVAAVGAVGVRSRTGDSHPAPLHQNHYHTISIRLILIPSY